MKVLVTGATGFTGGHLARELLRRGNTVRALVRSPDKAGALATAGMELAPGDIVDAAAVEAAMRDIDVVYHIAAVYREARHGDDFYHRVNVGGTENVLNAAHRLGTGRVVHCSTVGVHGDVTTIPADESAPFAPGDIYQNTKLEAEQIAARAFSAGLPGSIFRPVGIHGPGDMRFLKLFKTIQNGAFRMIGTGDVLYHMTYIDDLVAGIILCGEHPAALGQTYILSGPRYTTVRELVDCVARVEGRKPPRGRVPLAPMVAAATLCEWLCKPLGIEPPLHRRRLDFFVKDRAFTSRKAQQELGFNPQVSLEDGLARTWRWYRDNRIL